MKYLGKAVLFVLLLSTLGACQKQAVDVTEPKTYEHYMEHAEETKAVAEKCDNFAKTELSAFSPDKRVAWEQTAAGISCSNAKRAKTMLALAEHQRELSEAAKKYGK